MPFDITDLNPGAWFEYPGEEDPPERVKLRIPDAATLKRIDAETMERSVEHVQPKKKSGKPDTRAPLQRIVYSKVKDETRREGMLIDYVISDWEIRTPAGDAIPCTTENKIKMMFGSVEFNNFVNEKLEILAGEEVESEKGQEKNLLSSAGGRLPE